MKKVSFFQWGRREINEARRKALLYYSFDEESEGTESTQSDSDGSRNEGPGSYTPQSARKSQSDKKVSQVSSVPIGESESEKPGKDRGPARLPGNLNFWTRVYFFLSFLCIV